MRDDELRTLFNSSSRIQHLLRRVCVNLDSGAWNLGFDSAKDADREVVRLLERLVGFDFEVEVNELERAGAARAEVVKAEDALGAEALDDRGDLRVDGAREPPVHQHVDRLA